MSSVTTARRKGINSSAAIKVPCITASTANLTLEAEQTVDGIALVDGNRCFAKDQTDTTENGIYKVSTGAWEREPDFDGAYDVVEGTIIPVSRGTTNADTYWRVTNTGDITIGTTALTFQATTVLSSAILNDGSVKMIADFSPNVTDTYDLGTSSLKWEDLHLNGNALIGGTVTTGGNILSDTDSTDDLGTTGVRWANLYVDDIIATTGVTIGGIAQPSIAAPETSHIRAGNMQIVNGDLALTVFDIDSNVAEDTWELIGKTGSPGIDTAWSDMGKIPATATILIADLVMTVSPSGTSPAVLTVYVSHGDDLSPAAVIARNQIGSLSWDPDANLGNTQITNRVFIPLGATNQDFNLYWEATNSDASPQVVMYYRGFITD